MHRLSLYGATAVDERVVIDRDRITGGGVTAGLDFALHVASIIRGEPAARAIQLGMEYAPEPPFGDGHPRVAAPEIVARVEATMRRYARAIDDVDRKILAGEVRPVSG